MQMFVSRKKKSEAVSPMTMGTISEMFEVFDFSCYYTISAAVSSGELVMTISYQDYFIMFARAF